MSERDDLLASVANAIKTYREGELPTPTVAHVDRWLRQFTDQNQLPFLREFDHVIRQTFLTKGMVGSFLANLAKNEKLVGGADPKAYWAGANLLRIQKAGQSQKEMVHLFADTLKTQFGLDIANCGRAGGPYIYLDDVLFTGGRVGTDIEAWITKAAPQSATVHVIVIALHTLGHFYTEKRLRTLAEKSGKKIDIQYWRLITLENRKYHKNSSDVLWPANVPSDAAVAAYVAAEEKFPLDPRIAGGPLGLFSSEQGRQLLESEFLLAGVKIRSLTQAPKNFMRPLGFGNFGVGFGSLIATYRNCPNNCPLALWWGDPDAASGALHWYPLLSRKTYSAPENLFDAVET